MQSIDDLMRQWPTIAEFARDIGIKPSHAQVMRVRRSIPVEYWPAIITAAAERGIAGVSSDVLLTLHRKSNGEAGVA